jgi:hypothetical protein
MTERPMSEPAQLPRGATWHVIWVMPLLVLLALVLVPWSEEPSPVFDSVKMRAAAERWAAATGRRLPGSAPQPAASAVEARGVEVRLVPAPPASASKR